MHNNMVIKNQYEELSPKIEQMAEADIKTVMQIESKDFDFPWKEKSSFINYTERRDAFVVRTKKNVIVGYVLIKPRGDTLWLCKMAIDPDYRRKGLGRFIIDWAQKYAIDQSATRLSLSVRASNYEAIEFYRHTGFKEVQRIENYYKKTGLRSEEKAAIEMQLEFSR